MWLENQKLHSVAKGKAERRNAFPSIKLRGFGHGAVEGWAEEEAMGSDIYTAETAPSSAPGSASLPAQGHRHHHGHPSANGTVGADLSLLATAEHMCGTACPLPDTSTGPSSPARFW